MDNISNNLNEWQKTVKTYKVSKRKSICAKRSWKERCLWVTIEWEKLDSLGLVTLADLKKLFHLRLICQNSISNGADWQKLFHLRLICPNSSWPPDGSTVKNFQMLILTLVFDGNQSNSNTRCRIVQIFFWYLQTLCKMQSEVKNWVPKKIVRDNFLFSFEADSVFLILANQPQMKYTESASNEKMVT